ncbi:hypothetical protein QTN25_002890 [Entamoeba marina]
MFWSVVIPPNKKIPLNQTTMIHLTNACIKVKGKVDPAKRANFFIETGCGKILLCSLVPGAHEHQLLDIVFVEGEEVTFNNESSYPLHLSGYVVVDLVDSAAAELPDIVQEENDEDDEPVDIVDNWLEKDYPEDDDEPDFYIEDPRDMDVEEDNNNEEEVETNEGDVNEENDKQEVMEEEEIKNEEGDNVAEVMEEEKVESVKEEVKEKPSKLLEVIEEKMTKIKRNKKRDETKPKKSKLRRKIGKK